MRLEAFFEKFEQFAEAPNAVAKMRELLLGLAVRGRLVKQDPNDEPASELLKHIYAAKSGRKFCTESSEDSTASGSSYPFAIPSSWQWVGATTPAEIISDNGKKVQTKDVLPDGAYPVVDQGKVFIRGYCNDAEKVIEVTKPIILFGDHTRETKLIDFDFVVGADGVKLLQPLCIDPFYYYLALRWLPLDSRGYGRHFKLLKASMIPLPPLAEQKRIVAKVDELMALCDRLETQQQERATRHATLARAALARFADAPTSANLNLLFHPAYAIAPADIRKTILTLAVQGKLVQQDANDEPVDDLLKQIDAERQREKRTKATENREANGYDALCYDIPDTWRWQSLDDILVFGPTNGFSPKAVDYETPVRSLSLSATTSGRFKGEYSKFIATEVPPDSDLWLNDGDILVQRGNTIEYVGVAAVYHGESNSFVYPDLMMKIRVSSAVAVDFVHLAMSQDASRDFLRARASGTSGSMPKINQATLKSLPIPLPPLAEQRRIVAKADQLMALVDQLEMQLAASRTTAIKLMEAVVAELTVQE